MLEREICMRARSRVHCARLLNKQLSTSLSAWSRKRRKIDFSGMKKHNRSAWTCNFMGKIPERTEIILME